MPSQKKLGSAIDFKKMLGMTDDTVEGMYAQAHRFYERGKYRDALEMFRLLTLMDGQDLRFTMGTAASLHMLKEYSAAVQVYTICGVLDPKDPVSHYHAADCYIKKGERFSAVVCLEMAIKRAADKPEYAQLKERAQLTMTSLKEELAASKTL
jgi:type III secretion system low calcium response chaperone LcrH/SycD